MRVWCATAVLRWRAWVKMLAKIEGKARGRAMPRDLKSNAKRFEEQRQEI